MRRAWRGRTRAADGGVRVHALLRRSRLYEAAAGRGDRPSGSARGRSSARIGILVQGRSHLLHVVAELARRGIAFRATDIDPLGERPVVLDLLALTRAIAHLADRPAWLARAACAVVRADPRGAARAGGRRSRGHVCRTAARPRPAGATRRATSRARLERTWRVLGAALRRAAPLRPARHGRARLERARRSRPRSASERELDEAEAYLDTLADLEARQAGARRPRAPRRARSKCSTRRRAERADVRVELLTVHKAKGLQYDTVIVPGARAPAGPRPDSDCCTG